MTFPDSFSTERLRAERLLPAHLADIHRMHQDAEQMALLGGVRDQAQTTAYMQHNLAHWDQYGFGIWLLRDAITHEVAGRVILRHLTLDGIDEVEVGYGFSPSFWGRGLATEIASACLRHGRDDLGLTSIVALTKHENVRSQRVLTKIGMQLEREYAHDGVTHVVFRTNSPTEIP